jgi:hypothetical protein
METVAELLFGCGDAVLMLLYIGVKYAMNKILQMVRMSIEYFF